jgi:hypothetical protein
VRNAGTLGGNVANGSPIGDSMPLLIALRAQVVLASQARGERSAALEDLYTGYRQNVMAPDELLVRILVPRPRAGRTGCAPTRISKRFDDDISAVCLVLNLDIAGGTVQRASIGAGGVAATPVRARQTEAALQGQPWTEATVQQAARAAGRVQPHLGHARQRRLPPHGAGQPAAALLAGKPGRRPGQHRLKILQATHWSPWHETPPTPCPHAPCPPRHAAMGPVTLPRKRPRPGGGRAHYIDDLPEVKGTLYAAPILSTVAHGTPERRGCAAPRWPCPACAAWCWRPTCRATRCWPPLRTTNPCSQWTPCSTSAR